ncbi:MAG: tRNA pseudouridine(13) synthase TruD, partial [Planctomycetota bacterium]
GAKGDNGRVGLALLARRWSEALERICGRPGPGDFGDVLLAREAFERGDWEGCAAAWPRAYGEQAYLVQRYVEYGADESAAERCLERMRKGTQRFYLNAAQSQLFNELLVERVGRREWSVEGDVLEHEGRARRFDDVRDAAARIADGSATPLLPLFGRRDPVRASGAALAAEDAALERHGLDRRGFGRSGRVSLAGSRRPVRVALIDAHGAPGSDEHGAYFELNFELPPGAYATQVVGELCQDRLRVGPPDATTPID